MSKTTSRFFKRLISLGLCVALLLSVAPLTLYAEEDAAYLYDPTTVDEEMFKQNSEVAAEYPNGFLTLPITSISLMMEDLYVFDVYRRGGTAGKASVTVSAIDISACYGRDYVLLDSDLSEIDGEAAPLLSLEGVPVTPTTIFSEQQLVDQDMTEEERLTMSELLNTAVDTMPSAASYTLTFADGEAKKRVYIRTYQKDEVTDDLQFTLTLSDAVGASLDVNQSAVFTILETREKPDTYLSVSDVTVDPESDLAVVTVTRSGNTGTMVDYRFVTQSDTAIAGEDYAPVQKSLTFLPGTTVHTVEIPVRDAEDGTSFYATLEDASGAIVTAPSATVSFASGGMIRSTALSQVARNEIIVDLDDTMKKDTSTSHGSTSETSYSESSDKIKLSVDNNWYTGENAIGAVSEDQIDFTGVDKMRFVMDIHGGSVKGDRTVVYASNDRYWDSGTSSFSNLYNVDDKGEGGVYSMMEIDTDYLAHTIDLSITGKRYLRFAVVRESGLVASCGTSFYNENLTSTDSDAHRFSLILQKYNLSVLQPDALTVMENGTTVSKAPVSAVSLTDPAASAGSSTSASSVGIYRDETTSLTWQSTIIPGARLTGVNFINGSNKKFLSMSNASLKLTAQILTDYASYIDGTNIVIQPVFALSSSSMTVDSPTFDGNNTKFTADNTNHKGTLTIANQTIANTTWQSLSDRSYSQGDTVRFTTTFVSGYEDYLTVHYQVRQASSSGGLATAEPVTYTTNDGIADIPLSLPYVSVKPLFSAKEGLMRLRVTNANNGDFTGKPTDTTVSDNFEVIERFSASAVGDIVTLNAVPQTGYRAVWQYVDATTNVTKTFYGNEFYYVVQSTMKEEGNYVYLTFEQVSATYLTGVYIGGTVSMQDGSILFPPDASASTYSPVSEGMVMMGGLSAMSDKNGAFALSTTTDNADGTQTVTPTLVYTHREEVRRFRVLHQGRYFLTDVYMSDYITNTTTAGDSLKVDLKLPYASYGPHPTSVTAVSTGGTAYADSIPLVDMDNVKFTLAFTNGGTDKDINLVRWLVEDEEGSEQTHYDDTIESGENTTSSMWNPPLSELARPGQKIWVELMHVDYDSNGNATYASYGKFHTGYTLTSVAVGAEMSYIPDFGVDPTMTAVKPVPAFGTWIPTFSFKGFNPIFNVEEGYAIDGTATKTITIGVSFGKMKNKLAADDSWKAFGMKEKMELMSSTLNGLNEQFRHNPESAKKWATPSQMHTALHLGKVAPSYNVTVCVQLNYVEDPVNGSYRVMSTCIILGGAGAIRISIPVLLWGIPCFGYFEDTLSAAVFLGNTPVKTSTGEVQGVYLYEAGDPSKWETDGMFGISNTMKVGVGVGFDGLVSASGDVALELAFQYDTFVRGKCVLTMAGGLNVELLFLKHTWAHDFFEEVIFQNNNSSELSALAQEIAASEYEQNLLALPLSELTMGERTEESLRTMIMQNGVLADNLTSTASMSMVPLEDGTYFVAGTPDDLSRESAANRYMLKYGIYDPATGTFQDKGSVIESMIQNGGALPAFAADTIDYAPQVYDAGENLLLVWNKASVVFDEQTDSPTMLRNLEVASVFYNKESGSFHHYNITNSSDDVSNFHPQAVYDKATDTVQIFWIRMDVTDLQASTTVEQFEQMPTTLYTTTLDLSGETVSEPEEVVSTHTYIKHFDAQSFNDETYLLYAAGDTTGLTNENNQNILYLDVFTPAADGAVLKDHLQVLSDDYHAAGIDLAEVTGPYGQVSNLLAFYKCNDRFAYTNLTEWLALGLYQATEGQAPVYLVEESETQINDDVTVVSNNSGDIYQLWTESLGTEQQIYGRRYYYSDVTAVSTAPVIENGEAVYDAEGNVTTYELAEPVHVVRGSWGPAVAITDNTDLPYKRGFVGNVKDNGDLVLLYNQYATDMDFSNVLNEMTEEDILAFEPSEPTPSTAKNEITRNQVVMTTYTAESDFVFVEGNELMLSDPFVSPGETITVTTAIQNAGMHIGRGTTVSLFANDELVETKLVDMWTDAYAREFTFLYTLPEDMTASEVTLSIAVTDLFQETPTRFDYTLVEQGNLLIQSAALSPATLLSKSRDTAQYLVNVQLTNRGNLPTEEQELHLTHLDEKALFASIGEDSSADIYTDLGMTTVPALQSGETVTLTFVSEDIPETLFDMGGTAPFTVMVVDDTADVPQGKCSAHYDIGYMYAPTAPTVQMLDIASDKTTLSIGEYTTLDLTVDTRTALLYDKVTYTSSDETIAFVNDLGIVIGRTNGTATITATTESGVTTTIDVTVTRASIREAMALYYASSGLSTLTDAQTIGFDVNADGVTNMVDTMLLYQRVSGRA